MPSEPTKRRATLPQKFKPAKAPLNELHRVSQEIATLTSRMNQCTRTLQVQFERISQLQADIDSLRIVWEQANPKNRA